MKTYAILIESYTHEEHESYILDSKGYMTEMEAYDRMIEEANLTLDKMNKRPPSEFVLNVDSKYHCCHIEADYENDYVHYYVIQLDIEEKGK